jgi:hypothetical protein
MSLDDALDKAKSENDVRTRWIGVYIGVLAVLLAFCGMGGGNAAKDATRTNIEASNTWAFFQAKNMRRHMVRLQNEELALWLMKEPGMPADARRRIEERIAENKRVEARLASEPSTGEGLDELFKKGKALEKERDVAMRKDPYFDWAEALLQIAIVVASVSLITGSMTLLAASGGLALLGSVMTFNGYTLAFAFPGFG